MKSEVLDAYADTEIEVAIVWINMIGSDNAEAARKSSTIFASDPRVTQFYDPNSKAGYAFADGLLYKNVGPAWDIYMFYDKDANWNDHPTRPIDWMHQLGGGRRADPNYFRPGQKLVEQLRKSTKAFLK